MPSVLPEQMLSSHWMWKLLQLRLDGTVLIRERRKEREKEQRFSYFYVFTFVHDGDLLNLLPSS